MPRSRGVAMHTHVGALIITTAFLGTLLAGTLWRLTAAHLAVSSNATFQQIAGAMKVQY